LNWQIQGIKPFNETDYCFGLSLTKKIKKPAGALNPRARNHNEHECPDCEKREQRKCFLTLAVTD
jgi:hypothetical protein